MADPETSESAPTDEAGSQRRAWEREYAEVRAYTTSYRRDLDRGMQMFRAYLEATGEGIEGPVVECGCGIGRNLLPLAAEGLDVIGLDHAQVALDRFRALAGEEDLLDRVCLRRHDLAKPLPLEDASVGTSLDITAADNLLDPDRRRRYGAEIARILRPGGHHLVVTFSHRDGYYRRWLPGTARTPGSRERFGDGTGRRGVGDPLRGSPTGPDLGRLVVEDPHTGIRNQLFTAELLEAAFPPTLRRRVAATLVFRDEAARQAWTRVFLLRVYRRDGG